MKHDFADLIEAKDVAIANDDEARKTMDDAAAQLEQAQTYYAETTAAREAAHQAIHDILVEYGEHYDIDKNSGTVTVYKPSDEPPGWCAVHPIPGRTKKAK